MCYTEFVLSEVSVMNIASNLKVVFHLQEFVDNLVTEEELPESEKEKFMVNTFAHNYLNMDSCVWPCCPCQVSGVYGY
jgi:hypothetical protein